ncbi:MAG: filamentous hemagglutinin N-terminal domain-containing protein, partial [Pseudomonadota bacterium]
MRIKRMNRHLCFWDFSSLLHSWHNRPGRHRRALQTTGCLHRLSRLAPNFPYRRGLLALSLVLPATALAGPAGEQVTAGIATITRPNSVTTLITQQTPKAVIDWQNFSIAGPEMVRFQQPGTDSIALNRVTGNDPSRIYGSLTANGQVFLVNPNGVLFAPGSQISVHGLLATTHDINNDDFMAGSYTFTPEENPYRDAEVVNQGNLTASDGGYIVLAGDYTANAGVISARLGQVTLASGNRFTLDLDGDRLIGLAVDEASLAQHAGVENFGTLAADSGRVVMTAKVAGELAGTVVNNKGLVQARSIGGQNGEIILYGGTAGIAANSGTLDASGGNNGETGGSVRILGEKVGLLDRGVVDVSGINGGGTALIGGDYQGRPMQLPLPFAGVYAALPNAQATYLGQDTVIRADATGNGDGGRVIVWADDVTRAYGSVSARGGATGGDGGFVEVSGRGHLDFQGLVSTLAPFGRTGTLLLDPTNIWIAADDPTADTAAGYDITDTSADTSGAPDFNASGAVADSLLLASTLQTALTNGNVTVSTVNASGTATGAGDITVVSPLAWAGAFGLTLTAERHINILNGATITPTGPGDITMNAAGNIFTAATAPLDTGGGAVSLNSTGGTITLNGAIITTPTTDAAGGNITLQAAGNISSSNDINATAANSTTASAYNGGTIQITSTGGNISLFTVGAAGGNGYNSAGVYPGGNGGNITINAPGGNVTFDTISTAGGQGYGTGNGGSAGIVSISGMAMTLNTISTAGGQQSDTNYGGAGNDIIVNATGLVIANNLISASGSSTANGGDISISGTALSFPNATSDAITNNQGMITLNASTGGILQAGSSGGAIVQGPKVSLNSMTGITGNCGTPPCAGMVVNTPQLDITNATSGEVSIAANDTVATVLLDLDASGYSLTSAGPASITGGSAGLTLTDQVNAPSLVMDTSGPLVVNPTLSIPGSLRLGGDTVTINNAVSALNVELAADTISMAGGSITATGSGIGVDYGIRFIPRIWTSIDFNDLANSLHIDPAKMGTPGDTLKDFYANNFEFDAGPAGSITINTALNVPDSYLGFEAGTLNVNAAVTGKSVYYDTDSLNLTAAITTAANPMYGIEIGPLTTTTPITVAQTDPANGSLWIDSDLLNQFQGTGLNIGASSDAGTPYNSGAISITGTITGAGNTFRNLGLTTSGAITQTAAISLPAYNASTCVDCGGLKIIGGTGSVTLTNAANAVDFLTATMGSGAISFTNSRSLNVGGDTGIRTANANVLLSTNSSGDIDVISPGIDSCYGTTAGCTSEVTLNAAGSISTPLIRSTIVFLDAGGNVVDTDGGLNNIVSGNTGSSVTLNYNVAGNIDLDAWGATPGGTTSAGTDSIRWSQPAVEPPPPPPPTIDACITDPTLSGCSTVLPTLDTCTADPALPGCSAVLPPLADCTADPALPGCTAVLPTIATCTTDPTLPGCSAVLPPLADCTANPALPGCTAILPAIATCTTDPTLPGCSAVLPPLADCTANPALPGCTAILPTIATCTTNPALPGCSAVLPPLT